MPTQLSRHTIYEYLPEIRGITAGIDVELAKYDLDHLTVLYNIPAREQYGEHKMHYAMMILEEWLKGTPFEVRHDVFRKLDKKAKWKNMLALINAKFMDYYNGEPIIEIALSKANQISRSVNGAVFAHDFDGAMKPKILRILSGREDHMLTDELVSQVESSTESVYKTINAINTALRGSLQLPQAKNLIEGKRKFGYRINPCYNIVLVN